MFKMIHNKNHKQKRFYVEKSLRRYFCYVIKTLRKDLLRILKNHRFSEITKKNYFGNQNFFNPHELWTRQSKRVQINITKYKRTEMLLWTHNSQKKIIMLN